MRISAFRRFGVAFVLSGLILAGCGPATVTPPVAQPTVIAQPTPVPTSAAQPTPLPSAQPVAQPAFSMEPRAGMAGTSVSISGWGFAADRMIVVRFGLPQPTGEVLATTRSDAEGRLALTLILPENLPSGEPVPSGELRLVLMDADSNQALASAPFQYQSLGGPTRAQASQAVGAFLAGYGDPAAAVYLSSDLAAQVQPDRAPSAILGLPAQGWERYAVGDPLDRPSEVLFVPATLHTAEADLYYEFTLVVEYGEWKINGAGLIGSDSASGAPARQFSGS